MPVVVPGRRGTRRIECRICGGRFRSLTYFHLRRHRGLDPLHPGLDYKERFGVPAVDSEATRDRKRRVVIRRFQRLGRAWSRIRAIGEMRRRHRQGLDLRRAAVGRDDPALQDAASRRFRSWADLCRAARVPCPPRWRKPKKWTRERIAEVLKRRLAEGRPMNRSAARKDLPGLVSALPREFGTWKAACRAAGVPYRRLRRPPLTRDQVLRALRRLSRRRGRLRWKDLWRGHRRLLHGIPRLFGTLAAACRVARVPLQRSRRTWTRRLVLRAIRARRREGRRLESGRVAREDGGLWVAAVQRFGNWAAGCRAARVPCPRPARRWSREIVLQEIRRRRTEGASVVGRAVIREFPALYQAAIRRFGRWEPACRAAGIRGYVGRIAWTVERVRTEMRRLLRRGEPLTGSNFRRRHPKLLGAIYGKVGSLAAARRLLAAGRRGGGR